MVLGIVTPVRAVQPLNRFTLISVMPPSAEPSFSITTLVIVSGFLKGLPEPFIAP